MQDFWKHGYPAMHVGGQAPIVLWRVRVVGPPEYCKVSVWPTPSVGGK